MLKMWYSQVQVGLAAQRRRPSTSRSGFDEQYSWVDGSLPNAPLLLLCPRDVFYSWVGLRGRHEALRLRLHQVKCKRSGACEQGPQ